MAALPVPPRVASAPDADATYGPYYPSVAGSSSRGSLYRPVGDQVRATVEDHYPAYKQRDGAPVKAPTRPSVWPKWFPTWIVPVGSLLFVAVAVALFLVITFARRPCAPNLVRSDGTCVECATSAHCTVGVCSNNACAPCTVDLHCQVNADQYQGVSLGSADGAALPACANSDGDRFRCIYSCQSDDDCALLGHKPYCVSGTCQPCGASTDCNSTQTGVDPSSVVCVQEGDSDFRCSFCGKGRPCATGYKCVDDTCHGQCTRDTDCPATASGKQMVCLRDGLCAACDAKSNVGCDAQSDTPYCNATGSACVQCLTDANCHPGQMCSSSHQCVALFPDAPRGKLTATHPHSGAQWSLFVRTSEKFLDSQGPYVKAYLSTASRPGNLAGDVTQLLLVQHPYEAKQWSLVALDPLNASAGYELAGCCGTLGVIYDSDQGSSCPQGCQNPLLDNDHVIFREIVPTVGIRFPSQMVDATTFTSDHWLTAIPDAPATFTLFNSLSVNDPKTQAAVAVRAVNNVPGVSYVHQSVLQTTSTDPDFITGAFAFRTDTTAA